MSRTTHTVPAPPTEPAASSPAVDPAPSPEVPDAAPTPTEGTVDFGQHWEGFWSSVSGAYPGLPETMAMAGTALVFVLMLKWLLDSRKGRNTGHVAKPMLWILIPASALLAPSLIIPLLLHVISLLLNIAAGALDNIVG